MEAREWERAEMKTYTGRGRLLRKPTALVLRSIIYRDTLESLPLMKI